MTVEIIAVEPRTPEWFALRDQDVTNSDLGAIAGCDHFKTPFDIWAIKNHLASPPEENAAMRLGRWGEAAVVAAHRELFPDIHIDYPLNLYLRDPENRHGGTPDGKGYDRRRPDELIAFEFKVISRQSFERGWADGTSPLSYQLQTLGSAMLLGAHRGILAALVLGFQDAELVIREVPRHAGAEAAIRDMVRKFWTAFDEGHAPEPDFSRDARTISAMFPRHEPGKVLDLSGDNLLAEILPKREQLKDRLDGDKKTLEAIDAEIKFKMGDAEIAELPGWRLTWKAQERKGYTVAPTTARPLHVKQIEAREQAA